MANVTAVHHVSLLVSDTRRALAFYTGLLGLAVDETRPELGYPGAWLVVGDAQIHLLELDDPLRETSLPEHGGRDRHVALAVTGLEDVQQALVAAGVPFTASRSGRCALFCRDPDGNAIELVEVADTGSRDQQ